MVHAFRHDSGDSRFIGYPLAVKDAVPGTGSNFMQLPVRFVYVIADPGTGIKPDKMGTEPAVGIRADHQVLECDTFENRMGIPFPVTSRDIGIMLGHNARVQSRKDIFHEKASFDFKEG